MVHLCTCAQDTHTFYDRLREPQSTSQRPYFVLILFIGAVSWLSIGSVTVKHVVAFAVLCCMRRIVQGTAMINCLALLLDRCRMKLPELGDRNLRMSTLSKCLLVFMKLRVPRQQPETLHGNLV